MSLQKNMSEKDKVGISGQSEYWNLTKLHEWDQNPRDITESGAARLDKQLIKLGQYKPFIVLENGTVLGGNMRFRRIQVLSKFTVSDMLSYLQKNYRPRDLEFIYSRFYPDAVFDGTPTEELAQKIIDGFKGVWVSVVHPKDEDEMLEFALSDNDRAGFYIEDELADMMHDYDIEWDDYALDVKEPLQAGVLLTRTQKADEKEYDETLETTNKCPKCGYEW